MNDLQLELGTIHSGTPIDVLADNIYRSYRARNIKGDSQEYREFRLECSRQLQGLSLDEVKELSKTLLLKYDLRRLGYELIYYHNFNN